jgi:hypothetical protein
LFLEAVGKVLHKRVAQMDHEVGCVTDSYQHRRIARAANFDVPQSIDIGSGRPRYRLTTQMLGEQIK